MSGLDAALRNSNSYKPLGRKSNALAFLNRLEKLKQKHEQRQSVAQLATAAPVKQMAWDEDEEEEESSNSSSQTAPQAPGTFPRHHVAYLMLFLGYSGFSVARDKIAEIANQMAFDQDSSCAASRLLFRCAAVSEFRFENRIFFAGDN